MKLFWEKLREIAHLSSPQRRMAVIDGHLKVVQDELGKYKELTELAKKYEESLLRLKEEGWGTQEQGGIIGECIAYMLEMRKKLLRVNAEHKLLK